MLESEVEAFEARALRFGASGAWKRLRRSLRLNLIERSALQGRKRASDVLLVKLKLDRGGKNILYPSPMQNVHAQSTHPNACGRFWTHTS